MADRGGYPKHRVYYVKSIEGGKPAVETPPVSEEQRLAFLAGVKAYIAHRRRSKPRSSEEAADAR